MEPKDLDFLGIGAPKSGTTSLFHYIRSHPELYIPFGKDAPFFCDEQLYQDGWGPFAARTFEGAPRDRLWGKITPQYMGDPRVADRIYRTMPRVRLLVLLRNPIERAFSDWRMRRRESGRESRAFAEVVEDQLDPTALREARACRYGEVDPKHLVVARGEYGRILAPFFDRFPREQIHVQFTDDLARSPSSVVRSVLEFLELSTDHEPRALGKRFHRGGERRILKGLVSAAANRRLLRTGWRTLPRSWRISLFYWLSQDLGIVRSKAPSISPETRQRLRTFYRPDIEWLEALLRRPVPWNEFRDP